MATQITLPATTFVCDYCHNQDSLPTNELNVLPPTGWMALTGVFREEAVDGMKIFAAEKRWHICPNCIPTWLPGGKPKN